MYASSRRPGAFVLALHALTFAALIVWSWRKWPDPLVDFGRELYVPWQILQGKVLFRDIASLFGPLSPYVNALWFRLFGVSLMTLALVNIAILACMLGGIYHLLRPSTDRTTAAAATLTAVLLFGFSQYLDVGNYNFVTPYSHEATHGLALSVAALVALGASLPSRRVWTAAASGFCFGLVLLTKPEIAIALTVAALAGFAAAWWIAQTHDSTARTPVLFLAGSLVAPLAFAIYFHMFAGMRLTDALRAVGGGWIPAFATSIPRNAFYARVTGFDHPARHAAQALVTFAGFVLVVAAAVALSSIPAARRWQRMLLVVPQTVFLLIVAYAVPHFEVSRAFPLIAACGALAAAASVRRIYLSSQAGAPQISLLMWSVFSVAMLAKMLLNAQIYHYGFYLALPAATVTVVVLLWTVPHLVAVVTGGAVARRTRWLLAGAIAVSIAPHLALTETWFRTRTVPVGAEGDRFLASGGLQWQGEAVRDAIGWIEQHTPPDATVAVVPEGIMINYLTRRSTPVRFVNYMPPEVMAFGETAIVDALDAHPPDYILLVDRDTSEYGYGFFGSDVRYGRATMSWIEARYEPIAHVSHAASRSGRAIAILKRR